MRDRLTLDVSATAFRLMLRVACENGLLKGKTVDATLLEANAVMQWSAWDDRGYILPN